MASVIVHEWIEKIGGSENVLEAIAQTFPESDVLCLWNNAPERFPDRTVLETVLARSPLRGRKAMSLPVMPAVWRHQRNHDYDWAMVSNHAFAHHVRFTCQAPEFKKLVYAHTPARYVWTPDLDERGSGVAVRTIASALKGLDRRRAQEAMSIAANSSFVQTRIRDTWKRESVVIHPPVEVSAIQQVADWRERLTAEEQGVMAELPSTYLLGASRLIPYKRLDLVIRAGEAAQLPVVIAGSGPEEEALRAQAARSTVAVHFVAHPSDALLRSLCQQAVVYVFPAVEDFGIMPVEAMAAGTPVVCGAVGGVVDSVIDGVTGVHVQSWTDENLAVAVRSALALDPAVISHHAKSFSREAFQSSIQRWKLDFVGF